MEQIEGLLVSQGYDVLGCPNGCRALTIIEKEVVDIAFLDEIIPDTSALELARTIKSKINKNRVVNVIVGGTIIADTIALLILAIVSESAKGMGVGDRSAKYGKYLVSYL